LLVDCLAPIDSEDVDLEASQQIYRECLDILERECQIEEQRNSEIYFVSNNLDDCYEMLPANPTPKEIADAHEWCLKKMRTEVKKHETEVLNDRHEAEAS
jgi:ssDNA-specific exonuclease RecJ